MSFKLCDSCLKQGIKWDCGVWEGGVFTCSRCGVREERPNPLSSHPKDQVGRVDIGVDGEDPPSVEEQLSAALAYVVSTFSEISWKGHRTGYDWNADPEKLTLLGSTIFEARYEPEMFLAKRDARIRRETLLAAAAKSKPLAISPHHEPFLLASELEEMAAEVQI